MTKIKNDQKEITDNLNATSRSDQYFLWIFDTDRLENVNWEGKKVNSTTDDATVASQIKND